MIQKLDEAARRRPDFQGGEMIRLADGNEWAFVKPMLEFVPKFGTNGSVTAGVATSLGPEFDLLAESYEAACKAIGRGDEEYSGPRPLDLMMQIAAFLLRVSYDLSNEDLTILLRMRIDDEESTDRWGAIMNVVRGIAPKPKADGSD